MKIEFENQLEIEAINLMFWGLIDWESNFKWQKLIPERFDI